MAQTSTAQSLRRSMQATNEWLQQLTEELEIDHDDAFGALRLCLGVLRDHLTVDEAAHVAAQLPIIVRGIWYHEWDPSRVPVDVDRDEVVDALMEQPVFVSSAAEPVAALRAVGRLLGEHISPGEMSDVAAQAPGWLEELLPTPA